MLTNHLSDYSSVILPPLHQAAALGDFEKVKHCLELDASVHALDHYVGAAPLHYAAQGGNVECVELLLQNGAHLNLQCATHGMTPLMIAVWHRHIKLVEYLLALPQINKDIVATIGATAYDIIGFGIKGQGTSFDKDEITKMQQLFHSASQQPQSNPLFEILLNISLTEIEKLTHLQEVLKSAKASHWINEVLPISSSGNDAHTPLLIAARDGLAKIVKLLLDHGADQTLVDYYMRSLPIHKAAYGGHTAVLEALVHDNKINIVLNAQGPFNGYTPLHDAVWHGHYDAARVLVEASAKTDLRGYDGFTPLELAKRYYYTELEDLLSLGE